MRVRGRRVGEWGVATSATASSGVASRMRGDSRGGGTRSGEEDAMEGERRGKEKQKLREREKGLSAGKGSVVGVTGQRWRRWWHGGVV